MDIKKLQEAQNILLERRHLALVLNDKNRGILLNNPDFRKLDEQYNTILASAMKQRDDSLINTLLQLDKQLCKFAEDANLPLNNFNCKTCEDTGVTQDGARCGCLVAIYKQLLTRSFDCGAPIQHANLYSDAIPNCAQRDTLTKINQKAKEFVQNFPNTTFRMLVFCGSSGLGKSHIASGIANALIDRDYDVMYCDAYMLGQMLLDCYLGKTNNSTAFMQKLCNSDLLVIDDLGTEKIYNKVTIEYLKNILDMRENKHTIITTNLDVSAQEFKTRYGERIHSRINDRNRSFRFIIKGDDLRLIKQ